MKKILLFALFIIVSFLGTGCHSVDVNGDEEAVLIKQPWFFGSGGVDDTPVEPGQTWAAFSTSDVKFKTTPVTYKETFDDLITDDNTPVDFDLYVELQVIKGKTPELYKTFGIDWYQNNIAPTIRQLVRDKASQYKMFDLAGNREVLANVEKYVFDNLAEHMKKKGITVTLNRTIMGKVTPPKDVLEETQRTAAQNQSALTQDARAKAETARRQAEINKAIADNAYKNQMNMTTTEYLHLRALEIEKEKVELIRGKENITILFGATPTTYSVNK